MEYGFSFFDIRRLALDFYVTAIFAALEFPNFLRGNRLWEQRLTTTIVNNQNLVQVNILSNEQSARCKPLRINFGYNFVYRPFEPNISRT